MNPVGTQNKVEFCMKLFNDLHCIDRYSLEKGGF